MDLQEYFDRVGFNTQVKPDIETLMALHRAHVCSVPFENIDVQLGIPLTTSIKDAYEKIVSRHRGGWCYEQNGLFGWVLSEIGFDVTRVAASVMRQEKGATTDNSHLCLLVQAPNSSTQFLADVGFGGSMIRPLELQNTSGRQSPYRLGIRKLDQRWWRYWEDDGDGEFSFDFLSRPAREQALSAKCLHLQTESSSGFVLNLVAQLRGPNHHKALRGKVLTTLTTEGKTTRLIESADNLVELLRDEFQLDVPEVATLWPRINQRFSEIGYDR
jgi:N-hydroxyarylamine O-acetyltransferase